MSPVVDLTGGANSYTLYKMGSFINKFTI